MMRARLLRHLWLQTALWLAIAVVCWHLATALVVRLDVTGDQRNTLSEAARRGVIGLSRPLHAQVWFTSDLQAPYHAHRQALLDLLQDLQVASDGMLTIRVTDPTGDAEAIDEARRQGVAPVTLTRRELGRQEARQVFMGLTLTYGDRQQAIDALVAADRMEYEVARAIRAITTPAEQRRTVGWLQGNGEPALAQASGPVAELRDQLGAAYQLVEVSLEDGPVPEAVDALLVVGPTVAVPERSQLHLDQFLMRGGAIGWFVSGVQPDFQTMGLREVGHGLAGWLSHHGVRLGPGLVVDRLRNERIPVLLQTGRGTVQATVNHPLAPVTTQLAPDVGPVRGLGRAVLPFSTPLALSDDLGEVDGEVWITSGPDSAVATGLRTFAPQALARPLDGEVAGPRPLVVALTGSFRSAFVGRAVQGEDGDLLARSEPTRMVVVGSADAVANNVPFVLNAVEWLLEDRALATLRSRQAGDPPLELPEERLGWWKLAIGGTPLLLVVLGATGVALRSRRPR